MMLTRALRAMGMHEQHDIERRQVLRDMLGTERVSDEGATALVDFWNTVSKRAADQVDEHAKAKVLVDALKRDRDSLRELRVKLRGKREDPTAAHSARTVNHLLKMLDLILDQLEYRWWLLREKALAFLASMNPAFPRRHRRHEGKKKPPPLAGLQPPKKDEEDDEEDEVI